MNCRRLVKTTQSTSRIKVITPCFIHSDALLGKLYAAYPIIENRRNMTAELAPITFTAKSMRI